MLAILPAGCLALLYALLRVRGSLWRRALLASAAGWSAFAVLATELLSLFGALTRTGLAVAWGLAAIVLVILLARRRPRPLAPEAHPLDAGGVALLTGAGMILGTVGIVALVSPPNTVDAMNYHLPRIVYWIQNHSVSTFPTSNLKQLFISPGAEYLVLQFHALSGGDRFDNLVQWFALGGSGAAVSGIAGALGADPRAQLLAAIVSITIPQGLLEASGAKNDYLLSFWLAAFCYFLLELRNHPSRAAVLLCGAGLGLACLTKPLACLFAPVVAAALLLTWPRTGWRSLLQALPLLLAAVAVLNAGVFMRNYRLAGNVFGPQALDGWKLTNDRFTPSTLASNLIRNVSLHAATPSQALTRKLEDGARRAIRSLGADPSDPATTWYDQAYFIPPDGRHEALKGNPFHLFLAALAIGLAAARIRRPAYAGAAWLGLAVVLCFLLFCLAFKWQPWHSRLHLPLFVLSAPVIGIVAGRTLSPAVTTALGVVLLWLAAPIALENQTRPLLAPGSILNRDRAGMYFSDRDNLRASYTAAANLIRASGCRQVGVDNSLESFEYPFLALTGAGRERVVQPVGAANLSAGRARPESFTPCAVFCPGCAAAVPKWRQYAGIGGRVSVFERVAVFTAAGEKPNRIGPCQVDFHDGWFPEERDGTARWRWSQARGEIRIYTDRAFQARLAGRLMSVVQANSAEVIIKGNRAGLLPAGDGAPPFSLPLALGEGENVIVFRGVKGPASVPGDARLLSIGVRNLRVEADDGSVTCE